MSPEVTLLFLTMGEGESRPRGGDLLPRAVIVRLQEALVTQLQLSTTTPTEELREALHSLAREARTRELLPEQLILILKGVWNSLPPAPRAIDTVAQEQIRQQLITICIKAYYGR